MSKVFGIGIKEQLTLRIDRELSGQMDDVILKVRNIAKKFKIQEIDERSPFKNVLTVATETTTSLEVIKNFIRYQAGRKQASEIWRKTETKDSRKCFADEVVQKLNGLSDNCKAILDAIEADLIEEEKAFGEEGQNSSTALSLQRVQALKEYIASDKASLIQTLHLRLAQLYLGYLSREHTALLKKV